MAKDRFSKFKPANWHSGFKQTGSFIRPYKSEINIVNKVSTKPKKRPRTQLQNMLLIGITNTSEANYNDWEKGFLETINQWKFELSDKQKNILLNLKEKYNIAFSDEEWQIWKEIVY